MFPLDPPCIRRPALCLALCMVLATLSLGGPVDASGGVDQDGARRAMEVGEVRPLDQVLAAVRAAEPGEVVALKLKRHKQRWIYELKVLTPAGKRREVTIDANTLAILESDDDD